jgi:hypothetical protein
VSSNKGEGVEEVGLGEEEMEQVTREEERVADNLVGVREVSEEEATKNTPIEVYEPISTSETSTMVLPSPSLPTSDTAAAAAEEKEEDKSLRPRGWSVQSVEDEQDVFESFGNSLRRGIEIVKVNRRGQAAFRTIILVGEHTLSWIAPTVTHEGKSVEPKRRRSFFTSSSSSGSGGGGVNVNSGEPADGGDGEGTYEVVVESKRGMGGYLRRRIGLAKDHFDIREIRAVVKGEDLNQSSKPLTSIFASGLALSLVFTDRRQGLYICININYTQCSV